MFFKNKGIVYTEQEFLDKYDTLYIRKKINWGTANEPYSLDLSNVKFILKEINRITNDKIEIITEKEYIRINKENTLRKNTTRIKNKNKYLLDSWN